jgi:hypothetical protein
MARMNVFVMVAIFAVAVNAGCEWYKNCGACVADSGCGWCSNDPAGVGNGYSKSNTGTQGKGFQSINNAGTVSAIDAPRSDTVSTNGVSDTWLVNVRGQYERVAATSAGTATLEHHLDFEGTGYLASPYFGQTWGDSNRNKNIVGLHKTKFTTELKARYTVTPYTKGTYTVSSVQSDTQATMTSMWQSAFDNIEFQIGNVPASGVISYPNTDKQDVYGSWPPNPTKFTTELKNGYTIKTTNGGGNTLGANGLSVVRIKHIYNDQHLYVDPRFTESFKDKAFAIELGPRGTGLVSGSTLSHRLEGSDPCRTSANEPCYENTRFLTELRSNDRIFINSNLTCDTATKPCRQEMTVASIQDDAHLMLNAPLGSMLHTTSKFKIKTFHASPYTYARKALGGFQFECLHKPCTGTKILGHNSTTFTKNLMAGYAIIARIPDATDVRGHHFEKRTVVSIDSMTALTVDSPFTTNFGVGEGDSGALDYYNYESCPTLTYENFDLRTENGYGLLISDGTNHVYDNVQYSKITTKSVAAAGNTDQAAQFVKNLKVGYTLTMDGITRTVTKIVDNTLLHVDRAFKEGVQHVDYSYRYSVRKTGDFHLHWKPETERGDYHQSHVSKDEEIYTRNMMGTTTTAGTDISASTRYGQGLQAKYHLYPPVCYNSGRCIPKTSHSLVGVESDKHNARVLSSRLPHQQQVRDYVEVGGSDSFGTAVSTNWYTTNCKPVCTVTMCKTSPAKCETRRVLGVVNSTHMQTELPFNNFPTSASQDNQARVRYVTGTGTVHASTGYTVTGASKETKTKFNSEFSSAWTITIGCGGATCQSTSCSTDADCIISGKTTGGKCTMSGSPATGTCTAETKNITSVGSDTRLFVSQAFTNFYNKVDYTIGNIPGLGQITNSQNSKIIDGNDNTRFLEQLKVGYTITSMTQTRTVTAIASNKLMTVDSAFDTPGITTPTSYKFSGKKGTGEVMVSVDATGASNLASASNNPKQVDGTLDVTQSQFQNELALGYLFMIGNDYKVVTNILSNTKLEVDTPFTKTAASTPKTDGTGDGNEYRSNDYNYESCWLSLGNESNVVIGSQQADYTNKKVYVEDACEIKPGCCGFKLSSVVYPDRFAYYKIRPSHTNMNIRVIVKTTEDNVDLVVKKAALPSTSSYDYKSVRESNPWALTVPQTEITCPGGSNFVGTSSMHPPSNCDYWYIGVRGDNRYPQKTGPSEYDLYVYTEFEWPNFLCSDASPGAASDTRCKWLGISKNEDANMVTNDESQAVMRLTPNTAQRKGSMYYSTKVHLYKGFETTFEFRMTGFSVGCNSVLYPSGFCGGGDGFAFLIQKHDDEQIACTGSGLGYSKVLASKQGNDWARHRCTTLGTDPKMTCDTNDDGTFGETCAIGALCTITAAFNGGCGTTGACAFQDCATSISNVVAVEFDTWNNLALHDPKQGVSRWWINATEFVGYNDNHVAIFASNQMLESDHALNEHFAATPSIPNLADGKNHTVKIKYWPQLNDPGKEFDGTYNRTNNKLRGAVHTANIPTCGDCQDTNNNKNAAPDDCYKCRLTNNRPGNLAIFIDDMKRPVLQTEISFRKSAAFETCHDSDRDRCVLDEIGNAYIGFTAATGGERAGGRNMAGTHSTSTQLPQYARANENANAMLGAAQNHEILNWKFCNTIGCVPI